MFDKLSVSREVLTISTEVTLVRRLMMTGKLLHM